MTAVSFPITFPAGSLDPDALDVVLRLQDSGYTTYFVGGCVRDLLLGREPKDFDVATDARPEELKRVFGRRCRIIGRRFKLGHVHAGSKVIEVATFRGLPDDQEVAADDSGFVVRANTFGPPEQDARSRDFTVNGLFYDPSAKELLDWVGGREDLEQRVMRSIGDADQRMREDPVRLLRAVKLASRLGFEIDEDITSIASEIAPLVATCPMPRVSEEIFRICESGHARRSFEWMAELGMLEALLPEVSEHFEDGSPTRDRLYDWLDQIDRQTKAHGTLPRPSTFTLLAWPFIRLALEARDERTHEWGKFARAATHDLVMRLGVPVKHRQMLQYSADLLRRMGVSHRRPTRGQLRSRALPVTLTVARMEYLLGGDAASSYEVWAADAEAQGVWPAPFEPRDDELDFDAESRDRGNAHKQDEKRQRRRHRRGGRRRRDDHGDDRPKSDRPKGDKPKSNKVKSD